MRRELITIALTSSLALGSCGNDETLPEIRAEGDRPAQAANLEMQSDLLELSHLADIDHHGLFIGLGGPARNKYTGGNWGSGWGADGADGDLSFTYAGMMARAFFPVSEATDLTLRFEVRPVEVRSDGNVIVFALKGGPDAIGWDALRARAQRLEERHGMPFTRYVAGLRRMNPHTAGELLLAVE